MKLDNHLLLHDNKIKALQFLEKNILSQENPAHKTPTLSELKNHIINEEYSSALEALQIIKDYKIGIDRHIIKDLGNGTGVIIRDARRQNVSEAKMLIDLPEKYLMQLINIARGAIDIINLHDLLLEEKHQLIQQIKELLIKATENLKRLSVQNFIEYNTILLNKLEEIKVKKPAELLQFAREIANFKDPHHHLMTLSNCISNDKDSVTAIELDVMLNGFTASQQEDFQRIEKYKKSDKVYTGVKWFDSLETNLQKQIVFLNLEQIKDGKHILPNQLIHYLAGIRNGYMKVTAIKREVKEVQILAENIHCGTPSVNILSLSEQEKQNIAANNIQQLRTYIPQNAHLNLSSLNSRTPYNIRKENFTIDQIRHIGDSKIGKYTLCVSPVNKWRILGGGRNQQGFDAILTSIGEILAANKKYNVILENTSKYLQNGNRFGAKILEYISFGLVRSTETKALKEIELLSKNPDEMRLASDLKEAIDSKSLISNKIRKLCQNTDIILVNKIYLLENSIKLAQGRLYQLIGDAHIAPIINVTFCKSGKDRTGYLMFLNSVYMINESLELDQNCDKALKNRARLAYANHAQELAGIQGGTIGCHSLKMKTEFYLDQNDLPLYKIFSQPSCYYNNKVEVASTSKI